MSVYFDVSAAVHRRAGLGRYAESLARGLLPLLGKELAFFYNREAGIEPLAGLEHVPSRTVSLGYKPWRMLVWLGQLGRVGFNRLLPGARLYHATEHLLMPLRGIPTVLTVHDLIFRRYPAHHKPLNRTYLNATLPLFCRRAGHIIAVSEQTKRDIMAAYGVPAEKISVIYEAADPRFRPQPPEVVAEVRARYDLPPRYVLFVGTIEPRKNLVGLLEAYRSLLDRGSNVGLVTAGRTGWRSESFFERLAALRVAERVTLLGPFPDAELPALYSAADVLAFPSLYEGFGLPVLEAMACGTPVVASNTSAIPEVAGEAGILVPPHDVVALAGALERVLADAALRADLRARGLAQAARFTWQRSAEATLALYRSIGR